MHTQTHPHTVQGARKAWREGGRETGNKGGRETGKHGGEEDRERGGGERMVRIIYEKEEVVNGYITWAVK